MKLQLFQTVINWLAGGLKIPVTAMRMFRISNEISGIDRNTLPTELIPLNSIQLSRGLLNFTILQSLSGWVFPYWVEKQYNPAGQSFIPRSHLGLSMNITNRNWTAVGAPDCTIEPVVDPAGMVTPFINSWSIDVWLRSGNEIHFPSRAENISQRLIENLPIVETKSNFNDIQLTLTTYVNGNMLVHCAEAENLSRDKKECDIIFAFRPFNPEGIAIIDSVTYDEISSCLIINNDKKIIFSQKPDLVNCSDLKKGDTAISLKEGSGNEQELSSFCRMGMANSIAIFKRELKPGEYFSTEAYCPLENDHNVNLGRIKNRQEVESFWKDLVYDGTSICTPFQKLNDLYTASISSLLLLKDKNIITPGPFTYHQFWFRDAAYMIWALDKSGFHKQTAEIIFSYPAHQLKDGYFRSQKGEWDSNGQAIWSVYQHANLSDNIWILETLFDSLYKGVKWIEKTRLSSNKYRNMPYYGLMPAGLSAEHLGLADFYFWDNFWSIAGIGAFVNICKQLDKNYEGEYAAKLLIIYRTDIFKAIRHVQNKYNIKEIPASVSRNADCGMIGSVCASYPLQVLSSEDESILATLNALEERYFHKGMFFQNFIHSGMNIYLTLQAVHAYLYAGDRNKFQKIFNRVIDAASPTLNYPEAIHPLTGGGCMGDGHHGWAAAEIVLALHEAFVFEKKDQDTGEISLIFLQGIPADWFSPGKRFYIKDTFTSAGVVSLECDAIKNKLNIKIDYKPYLNRNIFKWFIKLPFRIIKDSQDQIPLKVEFVNGESVIEINPGNIDISFRLINQNEYI